MIGLVALMPFLLALALLFPVFLVLIKSDEEARMICRAGLLDGQKQASLALQKLLQLNPQATALRAKRNAAEKAVQVAVFPPARTAALAYLAQVIAEQVAFRARQQELIFRGQREPQLAAARVLGDLHSRRFLARQTEPALFDLMPNPRLSLTPDFKPSLRFASTQNLRIEWTIPITTLLPRDWQKTPLIKTWLKDLQLRGSCAATIDNPGGQWSQILNTDKA